MAVIWYCEFSVLNRDMRVSLHPPPQTCYRSITLIYKQMHHMILSI